MSSGLSKLPTLGQRRTATDRVAQALREAIMAGAFEDGEELNQVELANHFNVSRVPIREALRHLQAAGLVRADPHQRAVVIGFTPERVSESFDIRARLELYMLERSVEHITDRDLDMLTKLCDEMDRLTDHKAWLDRNHRFHRGLLLPSGASLAMALVGQISSQVERYTLRTGPIHRANQVSREHRQILAALRRKNVDRAKAVLEQHILATRDSVLASMAANATSGEAANGSPSKPRTTQATRVKLATERSSSRPRRRAKDASA